jgi:pimeloyl-ACP methyl ester carboxylesterase
MQNARLCAQLCQIAYLPDPVAVLAYKDLGFDVIYSGKGVQEWFLLTAKVAREFPGDTFAVFQGSTKVRDWQRNFAIADHLCLRPLGNVHWGFLQNLAGDFMTQAETLLTSTQIVFTGHSAGGATAALAASQFPERTAEVYGFGTPAFGDQQYAKNYDLMLHDQTWFFRNRLDPIPFLPPANIQGYCRPGTEVLLGRNHQQGDRSRLKQLLMQPRLPSLYLREHDIQTYRDRLNEVQL